MSRHIGSVDIVKLDGTISGWSIDLENPGSSSKLAALIDGEPVVHFTCSEPRPDVKAAGFSTQFAGFKFRLPPRFADGLEHILSFQPSAGGEVFLLGGKQKIVLVPVPVGEVVLDPAKNALTGWVSGPENRTRAVLLEILADGKLLKVVSRNYDAKIMKDGKIPFSIALPPGILAEAADREIGLRLAGSGLHLAGSPMQSRTSKLLGNFDGLCGGRVTGWAYDIGLKFAPALDVFCGERHMMRISCDIKRKDLFDIYGANSGGFTANLPAGAFAEGGQFVHVRFPDGTELSGGPKRISPYDVLLEQLKAELRGEAAGPGAAGAGQERVAYLLNAIGLILGTPTAHQDSKSVRSETVELGHELIMQSIFSGETSTAFEVVRSLSMLGINVCRNAADFNRLVPVLLAQGIESADVYGVIDLLRQRRRPLYQMLLAAVLLARGRSAEGIDTIFDCYWAAADKERKSIASMGAGLMMRSGFAAEALALMDVSLVN